MARVDSRKAAVDGNLARLGLQTFSLGTLQLALYWLAALLSYFITSSHRSRQ